MRTKKKREILSSRGIRYCIPFKSKTHQLEIRQKKVYNLFSQFWNHRVTFVLSNSIHHILYNFPWQKRLENLFLYRSVFFFSYLWSTSLSLFPFPSSSSHPSIKMYRYFFLSPTTPKSHFSFFFFSPGLKTTTGSTRIVYFFLPFSPILYDRSHVIIHVLSLSLPLTPFRIGK